MAKQTAATQAKPNIVSRFVEYVREVRTELEKVTWPSQEDLKAHTTVVLAFVLLLAVIIGASDAAFQRGALSLFKLI